MKFVGILALAVLSASSAIAQDWSGLYGGVGVGALWNDTNYRTPDDVTGYWGANGASFSASGFAGYNFQVGRFVFGPEVAAFLGTSSVESETWDNGATNQQKRYRATYSASINGRFGYALDKFLPYVTAGYSRAKYDLDDHFYSYIVQSGGYGKDSFSRSGWNIGAGADLAITPHLFARAEYRYFDFGTDRIDSRWSRSFIQHAATIGIGYKF